MTAYDWFITLVAIPFSVFGFIAVTALWCVVIHDIWDEYFR